jgi:hypothetical protein
MLEAKVDGELIQAGPDSPEVAQCPVWGFGGKRTKIYDISSA